MKINFVNKMKNKVVVCGHFGFGHTLLNGQTVKTVIVADEIERELGSGSVWRIDTDGQWNQIWMFPKLVWALLTCTSVIILPAQKALRYEVRWLSFWNTLFNKKLYYVVIGGWLKKYLKKHPNIEKKLKCYNGIFVETSTMKRELKSVGFENIFVLPNCKPLDILRKEELKYHKTEPYPFVTFSRVMEKKGIGDLVRIINEINRELGRVALSLDIYGQVDESETQWFEELKKTFGEAICYKGCVPYDKSTEVLSKYFALVFPTKFYTEGVPGTIIDAYSAGLPVISSKWANFDDVIEEGVMGIGFEFNNWVELKCILKKIVEDASIINNKKENCLKAAKKFLPESIVPELVKELNK